jgi:predicted nucleic acid-binding protein
MIVVADTGPLNNLIQIEADDLLPALYRQVVVPPAVLSELQHASAPAAAQVWLQSLPAWLVVRQAGTQPDSVLQLLDQGEREAIQLALDERADLLLIDERKGRKEAQRRGLVTTGTLGVLLAADACGLIDANAAYERLLSSTTFHSTPQLRESFIEVLVQRRRLFQ